MVIPSFAREALRRAAAGDALSDADRSALSRLFAGHALTAAPADTFLFAVDTDDDEATVVSAGVVVGVAAEASPAGEPLEGTRFLVRGVLGVGGMGEVLRVYDPRLAREVALKVLHPHLAFHASLRDRFVEEAQVQASLQHPYLVPVHEIGALPDGRPWFVMDVITGESFHGAIGRVHAASMGTWATDAGGWSLHRLVSVVQQAARAVGYAHGVGVVHRDLKPQNLMVGVFGEVRVVDWGLARGNRPDAELLARGKGGSVSGTPAYMAPEQAIGDEGGIDARTDVYALGAVLYEVLAGFPPYGSTGEPSVGTALQVLAQVRQGPPSALASVARLPIPGELAAIVDRAMDRVAERRYADANALADAIEEWVDGSRRAAVARDMVVQAERSRAQALAHRRHAAQLRDSAARALASVAKWADSTAKAEAWTMEDRATALDREADLLDSRRVQAFHAALSHAPGSAEAHTALVTHYREQLTLAEARLDAAAADRAALHMRQHLDALPPRDPVRLDGERWLEGTGSLTLHGDPGIHAALESVVTHERRLVPVAERELGALPVVAEPLPMGRWRLRLSSPGHHDALYPLWIERAQDWNDVHPHTGAPAPLRLLREGELAQDEVFVPGGWCLVGGDPRAPGTPLSRRRVWVDDVVVARFPVTHRAYIRFLDDLVIGGLEEDALRHAPRLMGAAPGEAGTLLYGFDGGRFHLKDSAVTDAWTLDMPVVLVDWYGAQAYAAWWARTTGRPWRLLDELEWEKAARGVDGRLHPWGDAFDPSWCCMRDSHAAKPRPAEVHAFPLDVSVYGVRGMGGNVLDWTRTSYLQDGHVQDGGALELVDDDGRGRRVTRGGSWNDAASSTRCATRYNLEPLIRLNFVGFRLARPLA